MPATQEQQPHPERMAYKVCILRMGQPSAFCLYRASALRRSPLLSRFSSGASRFLSGECLHSISVRHWVFWPTKRVMRYGLVAPIAKTARKPVVVVQVPPLGLCPGRFLFAKNTVHLILSVSPAAQPIGEPDLRHKTGEGRLPQTLGVASHATSSSASRNTA